MPRVNNTSPHRSSLKAIPFCVPPQALYSQSPIPDGTISQSTSSLNAFLLKSNPPAPADRLNASLILLSSASDTTGKYT